MERRKALKNMGLAMGFTVATPTVLSLLQSCKGETGPSWTPLYFSPDQGSALEKLVDLILPKTDTPSASEVNVHVFLDRYMESVPEPADQEFFQSAFTAFLEKAKIDSGKENASDLAAEDLEPVLAAELAVRSPEDEMAMMEAMTSYQEAMEAGEQVTLDEAIQRYQFANTLRNSTIWAYKTSEQIGEEVLAYLPVPGEYVPCGDLNELTGGKAWSI